MRARRGPKCLPTEDLQSFDQPEARSPKSRRRNRDDRPETRHLSKMHILKRPGKPWVRRGENDRPSTPAVRRNPFREPHSPAYSYTRKQERKKGRKHRLRSITREPFKRRPQSMTSSLLRKFFPSALKNGSFGLALFTAAKRPIMSHRQFSPGVPVIDILPSLNRETRYLRS